MFNVKDWIKGKLLENNCDNAKVYKLYDAFTEYSESAMNYDSYTRYVRMCKRELEEQDFDLEEIDEEEVNTILVKQRASQQRLQDLNNVERKVNRESYRVYNTLEELFEIYVAKLSKVDLTQFKLKEHKGKNHKVGIVHISDTHFNERIEKMDVVNDNYYDFYIASRRLKKYIDCCVEEIKFKKIKDVYLFLTGDLMNSTRRLSEQMAQCTSLVSASLLATNLLMQAIVHLNQYANVKVTYVVGNESRLDDEMDHSDILASNNWDFLIFNNLKLIFERNKKIKGVSFIKPTNLSKNLVQMDCGFNALLVHGDRLKGDLKKAVKNMVSTYAMKGIKIHGIFTGHYHTSIVGDYISQCGSLCGSNSYSETDLHYLSRASQNFYRVNDDLSYDGIKFDLQNVEEYEGYDIIEDLEYYNVNHSKATVQIISKNLV